MMNKTVATRQNLPPGSLEQVSYLTCMERTQAAQTQQIPVYTPKMAVSNNNALKEKKIQLLTIFQFFSFEYYYSTNRWLN